MQGDTNRVRHPLSALLTSPCTAGSHPLEKQSTGLFFNSPFARRLRNCGALPQANRPSPSVALRHLPTLWGVTLPEALPLTLPVRPLCPSDISPSYGESLRQRNTVPLESRSWARRTYRAVSDVHISFLILLSEFTSDNVASGRAGSARNFDLRKERLP